MRTFKRMLSCLLVLAILVAVPVAVTAEEAQASVFGDEVLNSVTVEEDTGLGLAFLIRMNVKGAGVNRRNEFVNTNATAEVDGVEYAVVTMGAVLTNMPLQYPMDNLTVEDVEGSEGHVLNVPARYLCEVPEAESCAFAVRITNLPDRALGCAIVCRPYIIVEKDGVESIFYGDVDISTYNVNYYASIPEETPVLAPSIADVDERISVTASSAEYVMYDPATYVEAFKVSMSLENVSANAKTTAGDTITYACKDADGNVLDTVDVKLNDVLASEDTLDVEFYAPIGTVSIEKAEANLNYIPDIAMPAVGSDIDVTKKKNRIRVAATEAYFNEDGTIHVVWTFKNYTSNWITEETDYITYKYYLGNTSKGGANLYIGVIDTKKNPVKTFEFDVPDYTTRVRIYSSKITYWTEWA